jgi:hypothetical protein
MKNLKAKLRKSTKLSIAAFMALWLSGFLFLFCPQMPAMTAKEFCPLGKGKSHCDKAKAENDSPLVSRESGSYSFDCCGFLPAVFDKSRKIEKNQKTVYPVAKIKVDLPKFAFAENDSAVSISYQPPVFHQNKIFIKNCVFRI